MRKKRSIVLATQNPGKLREIADVLAEVPVRIAALEEHANIDEPAEDGATFAENARSKALYYARATGQWCLADDSGLQVEALGGAPGVNSSRYAAGACPAGSGRATIDAANNARLLAELKDIPDEKRTGRFVCHLALAGPQGILIETFDTIEGRIAREPRGQNGFGYDPLFFVPELGCTTGELTREEKNRISHRGKAVRHFGSLLRSLLNSSPQSCNED